MLLNVRENNYLSLYVSIFCINNASNLLIKVKKDIIFRWMDGWMDVCSVKIKAVLILNDLSLNSFSHLNRHYLTRLYAHIEQFLKLCDRYFVAV